MVKNEQQHEKQKHLDAFETFLEYRVNNQTITNSIRLTAEKHEHSVQTVWTWYTKFDWKHRERERRKEIHELTIKKHNQEIAKNKTNYLKIAHKLLDNFVKEDFPTEIGSVKDLETVVKLALLLQEEATDITKGEQVQVDLTEHVNKLFDEGKMRMILEQENMLDDESSSDEDDDGDVGVIDVPVHIDGEKGDD